LHGVDLRTAWPGFGHGGSGLDRVGAAWTNLCVGSAVSVNVPIQGRLGRLMVAAKEELWRMRYERSAPA